MGPVDDVIFIGRPYLRGRAARAVLLILISWTSAGCGSDEAGPVHIRLPMDMRLQDTLGGSWLRELEIDSKAPSLSAAVREGLRRKGVLSEEYQEDGRKVVRVWRVPVTRKHAWLPLVEEEIVLYEKVADEYYSVEMRFGARGFLWYGLVLPYMEKGLISEDQVNYLMDEKKKRYESALIIESLSERGARLVFFGWGEHCERVVLM